MLAVVVAWVVALAVVYGLRLVRCVVGMAFIVVVVVGVVVEAAASDVRLIARWMSCCGFLYCWLG